eukprot:jgi/Undpi1/5565/HiC_scaffold_2.g00842.m1
MSLRGLSFDGDEIERTIGCSPIRVRRCFKYANDPETVAKTISEFWMTREDRRHRRQILESAMDKKELDVRDDSVFCHDFIYGLVAVDLDEIVGIQYITGELFDSGGLRFWRGYHHECESAFRQALLENGHTVDQSTKIALKSCTSR